MPVNTLGLQNAMGDFGGGSRRHSEGVEAKERFQRRLEGYRRHHVNSLNQFDNYMNSVYEQQRQDTHILHQNWIESRAKKVGKTKLARHGPINTAAPPSAVVVAQKQKPDLASQPPPVAAAKTTQPLQPPLAAPTSSSFETSSIQIDGQQSVQVSINLDATNLRRAQSEITLTFNSVLPNAKQLADNDMVLTSDSCKAEARDGHQPMPEPSPASGTEPIDMVDLDGDFDGLSDLLASTDEDFFNSLDFDSDYNQGQKLPMSSADLQPTVSDSQGNMNVGYDNSFMPPSSFADSLFDVAPNLDLILAANRQGATPVTPVVTSPLEPCTAGAAPPTPSLLGDTGPAAETLKQMAAQHQSLENSQYMGVPSGYLQNNFAGRYRQQPDCYLNAGYTSRDYSVSGTAFAPGFPQDHGQFPRTMQKHHVPDVSSLGYPSTQTMQPFADATRLPSSLQQLENQMQSHFGATRHCTPPAPQTMQMAMQHQKDRAGSIASQFHLTQRQQMSMQAGPVQQQQQQLQQSRNFSSDPNAYSYLTPDVSNQMRTCQFYPPQQQQQQQLYYPFGDAVQYRRPSDAQLPSYQNIPGLNHYAKINQHHSNLILNDGADPLAAEKLRRGIVFCAVPPDRSGANDQSLIANNLNASALRTMSPYCQTTKQDRPIPDGLLKQPLREQRDIMSQRTHGNVIWSRTAQQLQQVGSQHGGIDPASCRSGAPVKSYDGCAMRFGNLGSGSVAMSVNGEDQGLTNQLKHGWGSSMQHSNNSLAIQNVTQQQDVVQQQCDMSMIQSQPMHEADISHSCLSTSSTMLAGHGYCYMTDGLGDPQCQALEYSRNRETAGTDCHEFLHHSLMDSVPSIY